MKFPSISNRQNNIEEQKQTESEDFYNNVILLIDCSDSMRDNKFSQAKDGAIGFAREAVKQGYAVGLISFSDVAKYECMPSTLLDRYINIVQGLLLGSSTNMTAALTLAKRALQSKQGEKVICLVTDGQPSNPYTALAERNLIIGMGIKIITRGTLDADKEFLDNLATNKELSQIVQDDDLGESIESMARLLPPTNKKTEK